MHRRRAARSRALAKHSEAAHAASAGARAQLAAPIANPLPTMRQLRCASGLRCWRGRTISWPLEVAAAALALAVVARAAAVQAAAVLAGGLEVVMMEHKSLFDATMGQQCVGCSLCTSLPRMRDSSSSRRYPPRGRLRHPGTCTLHPRSQCPEHFPRPYWPAARRPRTCSLSLSLSLEIWQRVQISTER